MKSATCEAPPSYSGPSDYSQFPHNDDKYTCCCGIHATAGAKIVGILEVIFLVFELYFVCFTTRWNLLTYWDAVGNIPAVVSLILLFIGLNQRKAMYLVPYMAMMVIGLLVIAVYLVLCVVAFHNPSHGLGVAVAAMAKTYLGVLNAESDDYGVLVSTFAFYLLAEGMLGIWFLYIVYKSYRYLFDLEVYNSRRAVPNC